MALALNILRRDRSCIFSSDRNVILVNFGGEPCQTIPFRISLVYIITFTEHWHCHSRRVLAQPAGRLLLKILARIAKGARKSIEQAFRELQRLVAFASVIALIDRSIP